MKLRKLDPINYHEDRTPAFDDYVYCDKCADFVFEYCSIHGALLVIPDDKVHSESDYSSFVPRAALTIPKVFLHLAPSIIPGAGLGVFTTLTLPRGVRFGPYQGLNKAEVESAYCWQLHDEDRRKKSVVDAFDPNTSNWMRYVNCSRHWCEQNLVAYQYQGRIYYRTIKIIPRFTELLVFYGGEFAQLLDINLKRYDDERFFKQIQEKGKREALRQINVDSIEDNSLLPNYENATETQSVTKSDKRNDISESNTDTISDFVIIDSKGDFFNEDVTSTDGANMITTYPPFVERDRKNGNFLIEFDNSSKIKNNLSNPNEISENKCNICNKQCTSAYNFNRHMRIHEGTQCHQCLFKSNTRRNLKRHIRNVHDSKKEETLVKKIKPFFICDICKKTFVSKNTLRRHIMKVDCQLRIGEITRNKIKHDRRKHRIEERNKINQVRTDESLNKKRKSVFVCDLCKKTFVSKDTLRRHIRKVDCQHRFGKTTLSKIKHDKRKHRIEERYKIKQVRKEESLNKKRKSVFVCDLCKKTFVSKDTLRRHINIVDCLHRFREISNNKITNKGKPVKCDICNQSFSRKSNLQRHIKRLHSI